MLNFGCIQLNGKLSLVSCGYMGIQSMDPNWPNGETFKLEAQWKNMPVKTVASPILMQLSVQLCPFVCMPY